MRLDGQIAWVTGAGTGIGEAAALALAREGAEIVLTGRRPAPLESVADRIRANGGKAHVQPADLTAIADVEAVGAFLRENFGRLDILINNAGLNVRDRHWDVLAPAGVAQVVQANLSAAFYCVTVALPLMRGAGGVLIHTASMAGRFVGGPGGPAYAAAKHGVVAMSHSINMEECMHGIRSTVVLPGEVATPILDQRPVPVSAESRARMLQPEDCADLMLYVACLPKHVCLNEVMINPSWNRGYIANQRRRQNAIAGGPR
jgi:NAD(P)-dependent dehydrogenase (short-subunit alcohol dehydrogenase family)